MNSTWETIGVLLAILAVDASLSADNSIAIYALAKSVRAEVRNQVIWGGLVFAAILRVIALALAAWIIRNPWVQILGGIYLCYLAFAHFFGKEDEDEGNSSESHGQVSIWSVLFSIGLLDLSLSTDNVIAVVAMSQNFYIVAFGVLSSILLLAVATQVVALIMKRVPSLEHAAYIILVFLAVTMFLGHGSETIVWLGDVLHLPTITSNRESILTYSYHMSDGVEILCIGCILGATVLYDYFFSVKPSGP